MTTIKQAYSPIDLHAKAKPGWPETVPLLTEKSAANALRRLYRFAMGQKFESLIRFTSGNRRACNHGWAKTGNFTSQQEFVINVSKGWREFIHDLSHDLDYLANGHSPHSKHHARLERKLIAEVIKRGWLEPESVKPERITLAPEVREKIEKQEAQRVKLARIEERIVRWERKAKRAANALKKLARQQRYYSKALGREA